MDTAIQKMHLMSPLQRHQRGSVGQAVSQYMQGLAAKYNIRSISTLALFAGGHEIARQPGAMSAADLMRWVNAMLLKKASETSTK